MTFGKDTVIGRQSDGVQELCAQFNNRYTSKNNVELRATWGALLEKVKNAPLNTVDEKGKPIESDEPQTATFSAICRELGVPRSTAYYYIETHIVVNNYPKSIQDAAAEACLNLAKPHVVAAFESMRQLAQGSENAIPAKPTPLEAKGIVLDLKKVKPTPEDDDVTEDKPITLGELEKYLVILLNRSVKSGLSPKSIGVSFKQSLRTAGVAKDDAEMDAILIGSFQKATGR
jgi:hypothetical protein